jgi:geranylgeranyl reductase family protein
MTFQVRAREPIDADIAIVGAGPAGAASACHLVRAGFRVVVLDQGRFPRDKVCGDFVGPAALEELDRLGLLSQQVFQSAAKISNGALYINGDKVVARPFPHIGNIRNYGVCVPRMLLDEAIVKAALASGALLIEDARVEGYESDQTGVTVYYQHGHCRNRLRLRLLIGADGSSSLISRILRGTKTPRRDRIVAVRAYFEGVAGATDQADLYINSSWFPGYYWLFPTGSDMANVGIGMPLESWAATKHQSLGQVLSSLIESDPAIQSRLLKAKMRGKIVGWPLATFNPRLPIIANRVALIGDAAGLINPISGEGIQYALRSARWCAETLLDALSGDTLSVLGLSPFAMRVEAEMRYDMALSRFIIDLVSHRMLSPLWISALSVIGNRAAANSDYCNLAAGLFAGIVPAREFLAPPFFWSTTKSAVMTLGTAAIEMLRRARRPPKSRTKFTNPITSLFKDSIDHPVATMKWSRDCALSAFELATQMAISAAE